MSGLSHASITIEQFKELVDLLNEMTNRLDNIEEVLLDNIPGSSSRLGISTSFDGSSMDDKNEDEDDDDDDESYDPLLHLDHINVPTYSVDDDDEEEDPINEIDLTEEYDRNNYYV